MNKAPYFSHNINARNDSKIIKLRKLAGLEGLAVYWCILEMLYESNGLIPKSDYQIIAWDLRTEVETVRIVIEETDLFSFTEDGFFFSQSVLNRIELMNNKSKKASENASARYKKHDENTMAEQTQNNDSANAEQTQSVRTANALQTECDRTAIKLKVKEIKEEEEEKNSSCPEFEIPDERNETSLHEKGTTGRKKPEPTAEGISFANAFTTLLPEKHKVNDTDKRNWARAYDDLIRIDQLDKKEIWEMCKWARADNFWQSNFLSPCKLRNKNKEGIMYFQVFRTKMESEKNGYKSSNGISRSVGTPQSAYAKKHSLDIADVERDRAEYLKSRIAEGSSYNAVSSA